MASKLCCDVVTEVLLFKKQIYLATLDAHIVALDNMTGGVVWDKVVTTLMLRHLLSCL